MNRLLLVASFLLIGTSAAHADPITLAITAAVGAISSAIGAVSTFIAGLGVIGKAVLAIGFSIGLSLISRALQPKPKRPTATENISGIETSVQIGGDVARSCIFGRAATAGHLVYFNTSGSANGLLELVYVLGDGEHTALTGVWANGKKLTLAQTGTNPLRYETVEYTKSGTAYMEIRFRPGTASQTADSEVVANANPSGRWSTSHRGDGLCYVIVKLTYDADLYSNGIPQFVFELNGLKLYDPRKDSTVGGTGSHRWGQPSTYEFSSNPAICLYNYQRGIYVGAEKVCGMGLAFDDLNLSAYIAAANACDETVSILAGGTETRYRVGAQVFESATHRDVIQLFVDAMGGVMAERAGSYTPFAGVAQTPVVTITDANLERDAPLEVALKRSRTERVNAVFGKWSDPSQMWQQVSFPPFTNGTYEAEDGNERIGVDLDLSMVWSVSQAQRLAMIQLRLGRLQGVAQITLPFEFIRLEPGDWLVWNSSGPAGNRTWLVVSVRIEDNQTVTLDLREIAASAYSWGTGDETAVGAPPPIALPPALATSVSGFSVSAVDLIGGSTATAFPAIQVDWAAISDQTITGVLIEYRIGAGGQVESEISAAHRTGRHFLKNAILPSTGYQVRAQPIADPPRAMVWTSWVSVTTTSGLYDDIDRVINTAPPNNPAGLAFASSLMEDATGTVRANLTATVNANASANWETNLFEISVAGGAYSSAIVAGTSYTWENLPPNTSVTVRVTARSAAGFLSAGFVSGSTTTAAKTSAPGAPSALTATASFRTIALKWTNPTDKDLAGVEIWEATTNNRASATLVGTSRTDWFIRTGIATASTRYYWIRAVNTSGVAGAYHPTSATAGVAITTAGAITTTEINDDAITSSKIAANAITADEIAAGAVIADKIGANAVTADKVAANAITADKIGAGQVTTDKLAAGSVTANHIRVSPKSIVIDPSFEAGSAAWGAAFLQRLLHSNGSAPAAAPAEFVTQINGVGGTVWPRRIDVQAGEAFKISAWVRQGTGSINAGPYLNFYSTGGTFLGGISAYPLLTTTWQRAVATGVAPAGTAYAEYGTYATQQTPGTNYWVADLAVEKMADASLIVDGTITAGKIAAGQITSTLIAAGAVTTDKISARQITTDKITIGGVTYDELASVAATNMWGTSDGAAAGINNSGFTTILSVGIFVPAAAKIGIAAFSEFRQTGIATGTAYATGRLEYNTTGLVESTVQLLDPLYSGTLSMLVYINASAGNHAVYFKGQTNQANVAAYTRSLVVWMSLR